MTESVNGPVEEDSASEEIIVPSSPKGYGLKNVKIKREASKTVRVLVVLAYLLCVSLAGILLSVYYVCVWNAPPLLPLNETENEPECSRQMHSYDYNIALYDNFAPEIDDGGSNTTVSATAPDREESSSPDVSSEDYMEVQPAGVLPTSNSSADADLPEERDLPHDATNSSSLRNLTDSVT